jgi:hypothetical protein
MEAAEYKRGRTGFGGIGRSDERSRHQHKHRYHEGREKEEVEEGVVGNTGGAKMKKMNLSR